MNEPQPPFVFIDKINEITSRPFNTLDELFDAVISTDRVRDANNRLFCVENDSSLESKPAPYLVEIEQPEPEKEVKTCATKPNQTTALSAEPSQDADTSLGAVASNEGERSDPVQPSDHPDPTRCPVCDRPCLFDEAGNVGLHFDHREPKLLECPGSGQSPSTGGEEKPLLAESLIDWLNDQDVLGLEWTTSTGVPVRMTIDPIPKQGIKQNLREALTSKMNE